MLNQRTLSQKLTDSRIILLCGYIDTESATKIIFELLTYNSQDEQEPIQLFIGSDGGNYLDMLAIYDTIKTLSNPIIGTCVGMACGYSALILSSCTKGKRYALKHSEISLSQPYAMLNTGTNQQTQIAIEARESAIERDVFEKILAQTTGQSIEKIHNDMQIGIDLDATQALQYGIIDGII